MEKYKGLISKMLFFSFILTGCMVGFSCALNEEEENNKTVVKSGSPIPKDAFDVQDVHLFQVYKIQEGTDGPYEETGYDGYFDESGNWDESINNKDYVYKVTERDICLIKKSEFSFHTRYQLLKRDSSTQNVVPVSFSSILLDDEWYSQFYSYNAKLIYDGRDFITIDQNYDTYTVEDDVSLEREDDKGNRVRVSAHIKSIIQLVQVDGTYEMIVTTERFFKEKTEKDVEWYRLQADSSEVRTAAFVSLP